MVDPGEQRPVAGDRVGASAAAVGDADHVASALLVGLGAADGDQEARRAGLEVGQLQAGEIGAAQRAGVAEHEDDLRATATTNYLSTGVPAHVVRDIMGHTDLRVTNGYARDPTMTR